MDSKTKFKHGKEKDVLEMQKKNQLYQSILQEVNDFMKSLNSIFKISTISGSECSHNEKV